MNARIGWLPTAEAPLDDESMARPAAGGGWRAALFLGLGFAGLAWLSMLVSRQPGAIATVWFANALATAWLLFRAPSAWPLGLLAVALATTLSNRLWGDPWSTAAAFALPNLVEVVVGALLLRRAGMADSRLRTPQALLQLWVLGALLPQAVGATLGAAMLSLYGGLHFGLLWLQWFEGSAIGALSMLPLAFTLLRLAPATIRQQVVTWRVAALLPLTVGVGLVCLLHVPFPFVYLSLPLLAAAMAVEFAAVALLTTVMSIVVSASLASGLFVPPPAAAEWQSVFVYLAHAAALIPPLLLASAVADLRDSHARLSRRSAELRRANEGLEQFVRIASHDLREPLNTIVQFTGLVEQDHAQTLPSDARHYLSLVRQAAVRMRVLLDDVLQYTRLQGGRLPERAPVALDAVMAEVLQSLAGRLRDSSATLDIDPLPVVPGHAALLSLLLQNLLANALKFVPDGRVPHVRVSAHAQDDWVRISVSDNGIGIAEADLPKLFKPFQRLNLRRHYEGTGLGLALCRQVALAHGGQIDVASVPGEGTRFTVLLPLR